MVFADVVGSGNDLIQQLHVPIQIGLLSHNNTNLQENKQNNIVDGHVSSLDSNFDIEFNKKLPEIKEFQINSNKIWEVKAEKTNWYL